MKCFINLNTKNQTNLSLSNLILIQCDLKIALYYNYVNYKHDFLHKNVLF